MLDIHTVRSDFPILSRKVNGKPLVYFDNAATSQKPKAVIEAICHYYQELNANIHRGVHTLSQKATDAFEESRKVIRQHINAKQLHEVLFTSGTTHGINLVASGFAALLRKGDEVMVSALEHHSNIVPWQMLCEKTGAVLKVIPINEQGELILPQFEALLSEKTKIVAVNHVSNALGTINPIREIIAKAHAVGAAVLIDGAQSVPHMNIDVQELDCDFLAFSGHKMCGPTGIGVLYGKEIWLERLPPYQGGGEMIKQVTFEKTTYADLPHKFEAGTPNIEAGIVLGAAVRYLQGIGMEAIARYENELVQYATEKLSAIEGLRIYGPTQNRTSVVSFNLDGAHPFDVGSILDKLGIAVRTGHHCAQPVMRFFNIPGTVRASFAFYNMREEIDALVDGVKRAKALLV